MNMNCECLPVTLSASEDSLRFFAEPVLSGVRFSTMLRMTGGEGLRAYSKVVK